MPLRVFGAMCLALQFFSISAADSSGQQLPRPQIASTENNIAAIQNSASLKSINHIIFMLQENRSL